MEQILRFAALRVRRVTHTSLWVNMSVLITYLILLGVGVGASVAGYHQVNLLIFFVLLFIMLSAAFNVTAILGAKLVGAISGFMAAADADDLSQQISAGMNRMSSAYWKHVFGFITWALIPFMYLMLFPVQHPGVAFMTLAMVIMLYLVSTTFNIGSGRIAKAVIYYTAVLGLVFFMGTWFTTGVLIPFYQNQVLRPVEAEVGALGKTLQDEADKADLARIQELYKTRQERLKTITTLKAKMGSGALTADEEKTLKAAQAEEKEFARLLDKHKGPLGRDGYPKSDRHYLEETIVEKEDAKPAGEAAPELHPGVDIGGDKPARSGGDFIIESGGWNLRGSEDPNGVLWNMVVTGDTLTLTSSANPITMTLERTGPNKYAGKWKSGYHKNELAVEIRFITAAKAEGRLDAGRTSTFSLSKS